MLILIALSLLCSQCATLQPRPTPFIPSLAALDDKAKLTALTPELDAFFAQKFETVRPTGLAVGLVLDGELVYARTFGALAADSSRKVDGDTLFRLASMTKSFTALAVLQLRDAGRISLDAPLTTYLPELEALALPTRDAPALTARMLLTHGAGLPWDDAWAAVSFGMQAKELNSLLQTSLGFAHSPDSAFEYSNLGYALLGRLIERASGLPYRDYVTREILQPLGIRSAVWSSQLAAAPPENLARGYWGAEGEEPKELAPIESDGVFEPAGGLYMSLSDYARYAAFHLQAYPARDAPEAGPLRRSSLREMHQGQRSTHANGAQEPLVKRTDEDVSLWLHDYGFGWSHVTTCTEQRVQHGGWEPGYMSGVTLIPQHRLGIITFATSRPLGATTIPLLALLRSKGALPTASEPTPSAALLAAQARSLQLLSQWDESVARELFDPGCAHYPWYRALPAQLAAAAREHGSCQPEGELRAITRLRGTFRARCERGALEVELSLAPTPAAGVTLFQLTRELPPDEHMRAMAARALAALRGEAELEPSLFASESDTERVRKALAHAALEHPACTLTGAARGDGHASAVLALDCAQTPRELELTLDDAGKLKSLELHGPRTPLATCAN